jgi:hypothetical protein
VIYITGANRFNGSISSDVGISAIVRIVTPSVWAFAGERNS